MNHNESILESSRFSYFSYFIFVAFRRVVSISAMIMSSDLMDSRD